MIRGWLVLRWPIRWLVMLLAARARVREAEERTSKVTEAAHRATERAERVAATRRQRDIIGRHPTP